MMTLSRCDDVKMQQQKLVQREPLLAQRGGLIEYQAQPLVSLNELSVGSSPEWHCVSLGQIIYHNTVDLSSCFNDN